MGLLAKQNVRWNLHNRLRPNAQVQTQRNKRNERRSDRDIGVPVGGMLGERRIGKSGTGQNDQYHCEQAMNIGKRKKNH